MKSKKNIYQFILFSLFVVCLCFYGCSRDITTLIIDEGSIGDSSVISVDSGYISPIFACNLKNPKIYSFHKEYSDQEVSYTPLPMYSLVHIYVYRADDDPSEDPWYYHSVYWAPRSGWLSPLYDHIKLRSGSYQFYAIASNKLKVDVTPDIEPGTGLTRHLYNGEAYYWWHGDSINLKYDEQPVFEVRFQNISTEINLKINLPDSTWNLLNLKMAAPAADSAKLSISSGLIKPISFITDSILFELDGDSAKLYMLPFIVKEDMKLYIEAEKGAEHKSCVKHLPRPISNLYQSGYSYHYEIELKQDTAIGLYSISGNP